MKTFSSKVRGNLRRNSRRRNRLRIAGFLAAAVLVVFLFGDVFGSGSSFVTSPLKSVRNWVLESGGTIPSYLRDRHVLITQKEELERQLSEHQATTLLAERLGNENDELRALMHVGTSSRIAAGVVMRPSETPYDVLLIDRGSGHGITEGALVFAAGDTVIGTIARVFPGSALVSLISTPGMQSTVYIYGPDIFTTAEGVGGGVLRVSVPQGIPLAVDDVVALPTTDAGIFGSISHIEALESSPAQYGFVTSPQPLQSLRLVSVSSEPLPDISFADALGYVENMRAGALMIDVPAEILISTSTPTSTDEVISTEE